MPLHITRFAQALVGASVLTLVACNSDKSKTDNSVEIPVVETVEPEIETPTGPQFNVLEIKTSGLRPAENLTGSVSYNGEITTSDGTALGLVADENPGGLSVYTPTILELPSGKYKYSATYRPDLNADVQTLFRVRDAGGNDANFPLLDLFISQSGEVERQTGEAEHIEIMETGEGYFNIDIVFSTTPALGSYRFAFFPAGATEGRYEPALTGSAAIGNIAVSLVE